MPLVRGMKKYFGFSGAIGPRILYICQAVEKHYIEIKSEIVSSSPRISYDIIVGCRVGF